MSTQCLCSLLFNLLSLPSLSERSTHRVDRDGDLVIADISLGGFREFHESTDYDGIVDDWEQNGAELCEKVEY